MPDKNDDVQDPHNNFDKSIVESYNQICEEMKLQSSVLSEAFLLIYKAGLLDELSPKAREYLASSEWIQQAIQRGEGPNLEPRLSVGEYIKHMARILEIPPAQLDFLAFIVKTCYIMILTEKNPMVAQELRGVSNLTNILSDITRR